MAAVEQRSDAAGFGRIWNRLTIHQKQVAWAWLFLAVPIAFYVVIRFWPTANAMWLSFTNWNLLRPAHFVGLRNYIKLYNDPVFWKVFRNTFAYLIIGTPVSLLLSFIVAYQLEKVRFLHGLIRALYFVLIGWWFSGLWMAVAYALLVSILGMPIAFWMYNRIGAVTTLFRS